VIELGREKALAVRRIAFKSQSNRPGSRAPQGTSIAQPALTGDVLTRPDEAAAAFTDI